MFQRFIFDDRGQDMIEYALLAAFIGIVCIAAWTAVGSAINTTYRTWDTNVQNLSATTPNPIGAGS
jgi:Flp pilus assembly pilin Flp